MKLLIVIILVIACQSCGVIYEGKYGEYTLTPTGTVIIKPKYAKWNKYLHGYSKVDLIG